jgi:CRP/FNR family cyclic AMP-dependent transcriptional regulator
VVLKRPRSVICDPSRELVLDAHWARALSPELRRQVLAESSVRLVSAGSFVCRKGDPAEHWIGIISGLVKVSSVSPEGKATTFIGVPSGGWFGEGTLLKNEAWPYDAVALRSSVVANVPRRTFFTLLERSVGFNRFLLVQLNERLGQFVAMVEHDRFLGPDARLAAELAALFNPVLYPGTQLTLLISQEELGQLVGLSRARVNRALHRLESNGLLDVDYGGITVKDVEKLRRYARSGNAS